MTGTTKRSTHLGLFTRLNDSWLTDPAAILHRKSLVMRILDHMANDLPTDRNAGQLSDAVDFISSHFRENLPIAALCRRMLLLGKLFQAEICRAVRRISD